MKSFLDSIKLLLIVFFDRQKELFQSQQEKMSKQLVKASEEEARKRETSTKRAFTQKEEDIEIENLLIAREFKGFSLQIPMNFKFFSIKFTESRVTKHFLSEKEQLKKQVLEKVKKFQEKIRRINEDKEKSDQEKVNSIMDKYYKIQDNLVLPSFPFTDRLPAQASQGN